MWWHAHTRKVLSRNLASTHRTTLEATEICIRWKPCFSSVPTDIVGPWKSVEYLQQLSKETFLPAIGFHIRWMVSISWILYQAHSLFPFETKKEMEPS
mmetsp:Transcript_43075/g.77443  ORF Transcript_43075/g.77443 Transcript_43075/m.77443 type:complete len:98 (-) Transcript_43075:2278-2571(-)